MRVFSRPLSLPSKHFITFSNTGSLVSILFDRRAAALAVATSTIVWLLCAGAAAAEKSAAPDDGVLVLRNGRMVRGRISKRGVGFVVDLKNGRIQISTDATKAAGFLPLIAGQSVDVDYTYNRLAHNSIQPFTQTITAGTARIRHLPDVGSNWVWDIPSAEIQVTDDDLTWDDENFAVGNVTLKILDAGGAQRFGTLQVYDRAQSGNSN